MALAGPAEAGIGDGAPGARLPLKQLAPIEQAQFVFGGQAYCWYDNGWQGPGWSWCGSAWNNGVGWGGGYGWHGWRGGHPGGARVGGVHAGGVHVGHGGGGAAKGNIEQPLEQVVPLALRSGIPPNGGRR